MYSPSYLVGAPPSEITVFPPKKADSILKSTNIPKAIDTGFSFFIFIKVSLVKEKNKITAVTTAFIIKSIDL